MTLPDLPQGYGDKPMDYGDNPIFLESQMKVYGRTCALVAVERTLEIVDLQAVFYDQLAAQNHPQNLVAWSCWKDHAHSARKLSELIRTGMQQVMDE